MANLIEVKFERPSYSERTAGALWSFLGEVDEDHALNGNTFGGELRKIDCVDGKGWVANQGEIKGRASATREGAIRSLQPMVFAHYLDVKAEQLAREAEWTRRKTLTAELRDLLPPGFRVGVSGGPDVPVNCPVSFVIEIRSLTESDVRDIAQRFRPITLVVNPASKSHLDYTVSTQSNGDGSEPEYTVWFQRDIVARFPILDPSKSDAYDRAHKFAALMNAEKAAA